MCIWYPGRNVLFAHPDNSAIDHVPINDILCLAGVNQVNFDRDKRVLTVWTMNEFDHLFVLFITIHYCNIFRVPYWCMIKRTLTNKSYKWNVSWVNLQCSLVRLQLLTTLMLWSLSMCHCCTHYCTYLYVEFFYCHEKKTVTKFLVLCTLLIPTKYSQYFKHKTPACSATQVISKLHFQNQYCVIMETIAEFAVNPFRSQQFC